MLGRAEVWTRQQRHGFLWASAAEQVIITGRPWLLRACDKIAAYTSRANCGEKCMGTGNKPCQGMSEQQASSRSPDVGGKFSLSI